MAISMKGSLNQESLDRILHTLIHEDVACSLLVSDGVSEKIFYFAIGGIRMVSLGGRKGRSIGEIMVQDGVISPSERDRAIKSMEGREERTGQALQRLGLATKNQIESALYSQLEDEVCDLFLWGEAEYEFQEGQPPPEFYDERYSAFSISCGVPDFLRGVRQRRERWKSIRKHIQSDRDVFTPTDVGEKFLVAGDEGPRRMMLSLVDGRRTVRDVADAAGLTMLRAYEALFDLFEERLVRRSRSGTDTMLGHEEILEEIRKLEDARSRTLGDQIVCRRLAKAYEQLGDRAKAAGVWKQLARDFRKKSDLRRSLDSLKNAVRCVPEDFKVREQILEIYRTNGRTEEFLVEGRILAEMLFKNGLLNRARQLLKSLVNLAPMDVRFRKLFSLTLIALGEDQAALWELKELARLLEKEGGKPEELKEIYRRILALDKGNRAYRRKLIEVSGSRGLVWTVRGLIAAALILAVVGVGYYLYERSARTTYLEEGIDVSGLLRDCRFEEARRQVEGLREKYPLSSVGRRADDLLRRIEIRELEYLKSRLASDMKRAERASGSGDSKLACAIYGRIGEMETGKHPLVEEARRRLEAVALAEKEALRLVRKGHDLSEVGDLNGAHRIFREVCELYPNARAARTILYPLELSTVPAEARVFINGEEAVGSQPLRLDYSLATPTRIRLECEGFESLVVNLKKPLPPRETLFLPRKLLWRYEADGPLDSGPVLARDTLYVTGRDRFLHAIAADDGRLRFRVSLGIFGDTGASVAVMGKAVVMGTGRGEVLAVHPEDGRVLWRTTVGSGVHADLCGDPETGHVFVTEAGGSVAALDPDNGDVVWKSPVDAAPLSGPVAGDGMLFVGSWKDGRLAGLSKQDGSEIWDFPVRSTVSGAAGLEGACVCFGSDDGRVFAVDTKENTEIISFKISGGPRTAPLVHEGAVYVGCADGSVVCYDILPRAGVRWRRNLGGGGTGLGPAAFHDGKVYLGSVDGRIYCLDAEKGRTLWAYSTGGAIKSRPLVGDGVVYISSGDGCVYAIEG